MHDAAGTVDAYLCDALDLIDKHNLGSPEERASLAVGLAQAMSYDTLASTLFHGTGIITEGMSTIINSVDDLSAKFN